MNLLITSLIAMISFLLIEKFIIPIFKRNKFKRSNFAEIAKISWIAALGYLSRLAFYASVTYLVIWLILKFLNGVAFTFIDYDKVISSVLSFILRFSDTLKSIDTITFYFIFGALSIIFIILIIRNARERGYKTYRILKDKKANGDLPELKPTKEMDELNENIDSAEKDLLFSINVPEESLNDQENAKRKYYVEFLRKLIPAMKEQWQEMDLRRRIIPELEKSETGKKQNTKWYHKLLTFFTSQGLTDTLHKSSRALSNIGLIVLLISFIGSANTIILNDTEETLVNVQNLQIQSKSQKLDEEWKDAVQQAEVQNTNPVEQLEEWDEEDEETLNEISYLYETAVASAIVKNLAKTPKKLSFNFKANAIKQNLLTTFATTKDGKVKKGYAVIEEGSRLPNNDPEARFSKEFSKKYSQSVSDKPSLSKIGENYKAKEKARFTSNRNVWNTVKQKFNTTKHSFKVQATPKDVFGKILGESFQEVVSGSKSIVDFGDAKGKVIQDMIGRAGNKASKEIVDVSMKQFTNDLYHKPIGEAISNVEKNTIYRAAENDFFDLEKVNTNLKNYQPSLEHQSLDNQKINNSEKAIKNLSKGNSARSSTVLGESLADYKYHFPGQVGMQAESPAARYASNVSENLGTITPNSYNYSGSGSKANAYKTSSKSVVRSRSFKSLKGFRRVGGVLIGREPENTGNTGANFNDISWEEIGNKVEIILHRDDGETISAGSYDKDVVHQALAYVADGRLTTVTMVTGTPFPFLKILLHPTLVDTDLGCKAIGLDRLVDKYAGSDDDKRVAYAMDVYEYQNLLYEYVSLVNTDIKDILKQFARQNNIPLSEIRQIDNLPPSVLEQFKSEFDSSIDLKEKQINVLWVNIYKILKSEDSFSDKSISHLASKPEYYDTKVISLIKKALNESKGKFNKFVEVIKNENIYNISFLNNVKTEQWSGVRELTYSIDKELSFLKQTDDQNNLYPLSFIRLIVFNQPNESNPDNDVDENPWEFPSLKNEGIIEELIWKGAQRNQKDNKVIEKMKSFTSIQRVFRAAMSGDLGLEFPIDKLIKLAEHTSESIISIATPTWNSSGMTWKKIEPMIKLKSDEKKYVENFKLLWEAQEIEAEKNLKPCN